MTFKFRAHDFDGNLIAGTGVYQSGNDFFIICKRQFIHVRLPVQQFVDEYDDHNNELFTDDIITDKHGEEYHVELFPVAVGKIDDIYLDNKYSRGGDNLSLKVDANDED